MPTAGVIAERDPFSSLSRAEVRRHLGAARRARAGLSDTRNPPATGFDWDAGAGKGPGVIKQPPYPPQASCSQQYAPFDWGEESVETQSTPCGYPHNSNMARLSAALPWAAPWRTIGYYGEGGLGSGIMMGQRVFLTCAHTFVIGGDVAGPPEHVTFGQYGSQHWARLGVDSVHIYPPYLDADTTDEWASNDIAVLILEPNSIDWGPGTMNIGWGHHWPDEGGRVYVAGYPNAYAHCWDSDQSNYLCGLPNENCDGTECTDAGNCEPYRRLYYADGGGEIVHWKSGWFSVRNHNTVGGMSGAPAYAFWQNRRIVCGVLKGCDPNTNLAIYKRLRAGSIDWILGHNA
jgi:hypothetical protein